VKKEPGAKAQKAGVEDAAVAGSVNADAVSTADGGSVKMEVTSEGGDEQAGNAYFMEVVEEC
jgi:hypothetical protein